MTLTVPCLFGLESLVADEMKRLQLKKADMETLLREYRDWEYCLHLLLL